MKLAISRQTMWVMVLLIAIVLLVSVFAVFSAASSTVDDNKRASFADSSAQEEDGMALEEQTMPEEAEIPPEPNVASETNTVDVQVTPDSESVTVNGQNVDIPQSGTLHTTRYGEDGSTLEVMVDSQSSGSSSSSLNIEVHSSTTEESE